MNTLLEIAEKIRQGSLSPVQLTEECLARIEKLNPAVNAFITVSAEAARRQARSAEQEIRTGHWRGPLHGVPIGLKDLIDTAGIATTAGSSLYKYRVTMESAAVTRRLDEAGAILLGKQNLHEFAYGGSSLISAFGEVRNPWDAGVIAGGSSGGSAAAVALGMGYAAIGTDTAGSIREPAALCGVVGLKPTYGRVSVQGVIPLSLSLDHVGPITRNVTDAAVVLSCIGEPALGGAREAFAVRDIAAELGKGCHGLRVGVARSFFFADLNPEVSAAVNEALRVLRGLVAEVREIELGPNNDRTLQAAESYQVHAKSIAETPELYQPETLRRIRTGESITAAEYAAAKAALEAARTEIASAFEEIDLLVTPTTPIPAPSIAELKEKPELLRPNELILLRNTRPFNVWGLPAISVPCGFTSRGLPIGLQIAGAAWREDLVLRLAHAYEQATEWHKRRPVVD